MCVRVQKAQICQHRTQQTSAKWRGNRKGFVFAVLFITDKQIHDNNKTFRIQYDLDYITICFLYAQHWNI